MKTFKPVSQVFINRLVTRFWLNLVKNFDANVREENFFEVIQNRISRDAAVERLESVLSAEEIKSMTDGCGRFDFSDGLNGIFQTVWNHERMREKCRGVLQSIGAQMLEDIGRRRVEPLERRFREIRRVFKLSKTEYDILLFAYVRNQTRFALPARARGPELPLLYAMALDCPYGDVLAAMNGTGKLRKFCLLDEDWDFDYTLLGFLNGSHAEAIERRFYRKRDLSEALPWEFYGELAERDGRVIKSMLSANPRRCNILFYGAPGTGKTSFAYTLAKELGRTAFEIRHGDPDGKNMRSESRLAGVQVCNAQEQPDEPLMVIDEADELLRSSTSGMATLFGGSGGNSTEKGVVNAILDDMKMPAIWISNAPAGAMDESVRRRFDYSICFEKLNSRQRVSIWKNLVSKHGLGDLMADSRIADYAARYATSAGGISMVLENVRRMSPQAEQVDALIETLMKPHCKLMGIGKANGLLTMKGYSLEGLNIRGRVGLDEVVGAVRNYFDDRFNAASEDRPRMNLLMYGPPGTGKTEFVKHLGKELDRKVIVVKGSDILGKYVGESEQNIARAFRAAEAEHAILFFDEIDGLVQSRENAHASWEVSQVNELLQQMENFDGVMIAATNFCANLDPAIMRRFTFKLEFDYLDNAGKKLFFERMFKTTLTKGELEELNAIRNLAPGDFRTVRQELFYLDGKQTNAARIEALRAECLLKKSGAGGDSRTSIGFAA